MVREGEDVLGAHMRLCWVFTSGVRFEVANFCGIVSSDFMKNTQVFIFHLNDASLW